MGSTQMSQPVSLPWLEKAMYLPVARPVAGELQLVRLQEELLLALAVGGLLEEILADGVDDAAAVGRPDGSRTSRRRRT